MRPLRLSVAALLAIAAVAGSAAFARAAQRTPIAFTGVTASPTAISYGNNTVTFTGQLVEYQDQTVGVAGEQVSLEYSNNGVALDTVTTDANGDFTATATLSAGAALRMATAGDATHTTASTNSFTISVSPQAPAVSLDPQRANRVWAGTTLTFAGKATVSVNGVAQPLAGAQVELQVNGNEIMGSAATGADGTFTMTVKSALVGGQWTAVVWPSSNQSLFSEGTSNADTVKVQYHTRVVNVAYPATAEMHTMQKITGTVQAYNGTRWVPTRVPGVGIYYRTSSTGKWKLSGNDYLNGNGTFSTATSLTPGVKQVQVRALKSESAYGDVYLTSTGPVKTIKIYDHTVFDRGTADISHFDGRTLISGMFVDWWGSGITQRTWKTVTGTAKVYYRPNTAAAWKYLGSTKLGQGGSADYTYYGILAGYFYIQYPAQGYFLASKSPKLHISLPLARAANTGRRVTNTRRPVSFGSN